MALVLTIAGVDRLTGYYKPGTLSISRQIKGQSTAAFEIEDHAQSYSPTRGQAVHISDGGTTFDGIIDGIVIIHPGNTDYYRFRVTCVDYAAAFNRRFVARRYTTGTLIADIFADINTHFLDGEGFNVTNVSGTGILAADLEFDYRTVAECFNVLSDLCNEQWWTLGFDIYSKSLAGAPAAAFDITDSSANWSDLSIEYPKSTFYRNVELLRTAIPLSSGAYSDSITAAAGQVVFNTTFALTAAPTLTVGGTPTAIVEYAAYTGSQWYWIRGGKGIFAPSAPGAGIAVVITYSGYSSTVVTKRDDTEIAARAAAEGNSGKYEGLDEARDVDNKTTADAICQGILDKAKSLPSVIKYRTPQGGLNVGVGQTVTLAVHGISTTFYVTDIQSQVLFSTLPFPNGAGSGKYFWHAVTLSSAYDQLNWLKWWIAFWSRTKASRTGTSSMGGASDTSALNEYTLAAASTTITGPTPSLNALHVVFLTQDGSGSRKVVWGPNYSSLTSTNIQTEAGKLTVFLFAGKSDNLWWPICAPLLQE